MLVGTGVFVVSLGAREPMGGAGDEVVISIRRRCSSNGDGDDAEPQGVEAGRRNGPSHGQLLDADDRVALLLVRVMGDT